MLSRSADQLTAPRAARSSRTAARRTVHGRAPAACSGQSLFPNEVWRRLVVSLRLSEREAEIVPGLLDDEKESAIATRLGISRHTVHTYTERLYRKMGVSSRVGLVRRVFVEYMSLTARSTVTFGLLLSAI